jgi:hypothetical protein
MNRTAQEEKPAAAVAEAETTERKLKELVERFEVCWEVLADCYYVNKRIRQIGFQLELTGTHEEGVGQPGPGCEHCRRVWRALKAIADWIIPKEIRDSGYDVYPFDQTIQYSKARNFRPEVSLSIWIRHRSGFDHELDACEVRCLNEMTQKLGELGARKGKWRPD